MTNLQKMLNMEVSEQLRKLADWLEKDFVSCVEIQTSAIDPKNNAQSIKVNFTQNLHCIHNADPKDL